MFTRQVPPTLFPRSSHQEVGVPVLLEGDRGAESGESGSDDQHADMVEAVSPACVAEAARRAGDGGAM